MKITVGVATSGPIVLGTITPEKLQQPHITDATLRKAIRECREDLPQTAGTFALLKMLRKEKHRRSLLKEAI